VIDDIERCTMPLDVTLGSLNHYVEDLGFKAILIAHEDRISKKLSIRKEKLVGQTLRVKPHYEDAYDAFTSEIVDADAREFVSSRRKDILEVFRDGRVHSLRILRHVMSDLGRLSGCLTPEQTKQDVAMSLIAKPFCALDALLREGVFKPDDLVGRQDKWGKLRLSKGKRLFNSMQSNLGDEGEKTEAKSAFERGQERFQNSGVDLSSSVLTDQVLVTALVDGIFDKDTVQSSLTSSGLFGTPLELRSWWRVWHRYELDDTEMMSALIEMEDDFADRRLSDVQEILHVFGLRLSIANEGLLLGFTPHDVVAQCKQYVEDLLAQSKLPLARRHNRDESYSMFSGAYGLGFAAEGDKATEPHFRELFMYLDRARQTALRLTYDKSADEMISLVNQGTIESLDEFSRALVGGDGQQGRFALLPIFANHDPRLLLERLLPLRGSLWINVRITLGTRYYGVQLHNGLDDEIGWILGLLKLVEENAERTEMPPVTRYRLRSFADGFVREHIERRKAELASMSSENGKEALVLGESSA
jgi:hypothetical protein